MLFKGEDECRALDNRVEAFLRSGKTGDEDYLIIDTAEYAIPGLDYHFRVIVSPWSCLPCHRPHGGVLRDRDQAQPRLPSLLPPVRLLRSSLCHEAIHLRVSRPFRTGHH